MNKEMFFAMDRNKRVIAVNKLLEGRTLDEVSGLIGIPRSTFSNEMKKGDWVYIARENKYFQFIREGKVLTPDEEPDRNYTEELQFLHEHFADLKNIINSAALAPGGEVLTLDKRVYKNEAKFVTKSLRINEAVYELFLEKCNVNFPQYKIQDLIAQSLLDFTSKYQ